MNAKEELIEKLKEIGNIPIKCAEIEYINDFYKMLKTKIILKTGYTSKEYSTFLKELDFEYEYEYIPDWRTQNLFGTIWLTDGTWIEHEEYACDESWIHRYCPKIPGRIDEL